MLKWALSGRQRTSQGYLFAWDGGHFRELDRLRAPGSLRFLGRTQPGDDVLLFVGAHLIETAADHRTGLCRRLRELHRVALWPLVVPAGLMDQQNGPEIARLETLLRQILGQHDAIQLVHHQLS